ncbi:MAG: hypothetical protein AAGJ18_13695 [Bacteroidota bacterium]
MQRLIGTFLFAISFMCYSFVSTVKPDPRITISSPMEGTEFKGGTTVNVQVGVTCECEMDKIMVKIANVEAPENEQLLLADEVNSINGGAADFSRSITLPAVEEETDVTVEVEVLDKDGDDLESETVTITVLP